MTIAKIRNLEGLVERGISNKELASPYGMGGLINHDAHEAYLRSLVAGREGVMTQNATQRYLQLQLGEPGRVHGSVSITLSECIALLV